MVSSRKPLIFYLQIKKLNVKWRGLLNSFTIPKKKKWSEVKCSKLKYKAKRVGLLYILCFLLYKVYQLVVWNWNCWNRWNRLAAKQSSSHRVELKEVMYSKHIEVTYFLCIVYYIHLLKMLFSHPSLISISFLYIFPIVVFVPGTPALLYSMCLQCPARPQKSWVEFEQQNKMSDSSLVVCIS